MNLSPLDPRDYRDIVRRALDEDLGDAPGGASDVTTDATVPVSAKARGVFVVKADCVMAGLDVAFECFRAIEPVVEVAAKTNDGERCRAGDTIAEVVGSARTLLIGERTALNFLQRLCGIATMTARFVDPAAGRITILDTRKTTPTLRALEKYAVRTGGATNHRLGLFDAILIKDNHIRIAGGVARAVEQAPFYRPDLSIEVEAQTLDEVDQALDPGVDRL